MDNVLAKNPRTVKMKSTQVRALIAEARRAGVVLWVEGSQLHYKEPAAGMAADLCAGLRSMKDDVMAELSRPVFKSRVEKTDLLQLPAYFEDFWHETASNLSLANATHTVVKITGEVTLERLQTAFKQVFFRHDLLRARVTFPEGFPCLLFDAEAEVPVKIVDFSEDNSSERPQRVKELVAQTIWNPFEGGSLFRACLIRASGSEYVFGFVLHHLIGDLLSCHILLKDFLARARRPKGLVDSSDTRPLQYADYLLGMSEWLSGPALKYRLAYWKEQMEAAPPTCFPADQEVGSESVAVLDSISFLVDEILRASIARVAAGSGVTLLAVVLAADFLAMASLLQRTDLVITPIVAGRDHPALFELVGMVVDCLPVRVSVLPEMTFADLLQQVHKTYLLACSYHVPWALLRKTLREIDASCVSPLINFIPSAYGGGSRTSASSCNTTIESITVEGPADSTSVDWKSHELHLFDSGRFMRGKVKYMCSKYRKETIEAFIESFVSGLGAIAEDPGIRVSVYLSKR
jgi:hypothetical protein